MAREFPSAGARLAVAVLVGAVPALAQLAGMLLFVAGDSAGPTRDGMPVPLALSAAALVSLAVWVGCAVALVVTVELLAMFGHPTARRVQGWALLPGVATALIVLDGVQPWPPLGALAALACVAAWQGLLWLWWRLASRRKSAGPRPISP